MQYQIIDTSQTGLFPEVQVSHPLEQYNQSHFTPKPYTPTHNVEDQHHFPRFGHTNNFAALASGLAGDSTEGTDYIVGVCAGALLILSVGLVWFMIIVGLNIAGQKKVGFLAGRLEHPDYIASKSSSKNGGSARDVGTLPIIDEEPEEEGMEMEHSLLGDASSPLIISNTLEQDARKEKKFKRKVLAVRAVFVLSGLGVIVSSVLFYSKGVASFKKSLNSVHGGLELVQQTAHAAMGLTNGVLTDSDDLYNDLQYTKTEGQKCQGDGPIASQIRHDLKNFASEAKELGAMLRSTLKAFENDLEELVSITEDVDEKLKAADIFFGFTIAITVFITVLIVAMLVVTYFSARGVNNCCTKITTHAILWPVFIFFLVLAWIFALLFLVVSLAGSDFCIKPDKIVEGALREYQSQFKSAIFEVIIYYISGCTLKAAGESEFKKISEQIDGTLVPLHDFSETIMSTSLGSLESQCSLDTAAATTLTAGAKLLHNATHVVNNAWIGVRQMFECKTFNPIYTTFVHDAFCLEGVDGLTWLFSTSLFMFMFAMLMIMFRAGLYPVKRPHP